MPTISMFYGIVIALYFYDDERHDTPHIPARCQGKGVLVFHPRWRRVER